MGNRFVSWLKSRLNGEQGCERFVELDPIIREPERPKVEPLPADDSQMWEEMEPEEDPQPARFRAWEGSGE
jgi:hypothetical protein